MESWMLVELHSRIIPRFNRNRSRNSVLSMIWADMAKIKFQHFGRFGLDNFLRQIQLIPQPRSIFPQPRSICALTRGGKNGKLAGYRVT